MKRAAGRSFLFNQSRLTTGHSLLTRRTHVEEEFTFTVTGGDGEVGLKGPGQDVAWPFEKAPGAIKEMAKGGIAARVAQLNTVATQLATPAPAPVA